MKPKPISRYDLFKSVPEHLQDRVLALALAGKIDLTEYWEILYQENKDLVALNKKRKPHTPTMEEVLDLIEDAVPSLLQVAGGHWDEHTGSMLLDEDQWGNINDVAKELEALLKKFKE